MRKYLFAVIGVLFAAAVWAETAVQTTDPVEANNGWTLVGGGNFELKDAAPAAGNTYFNFSVNPGKYTLYNNRAVVKDIGVTLQAGYTYTITADVSQSFAKYSFIADAFSTPTSDQVAIGFFDPTGLDFSANKNSERQKIRDAINAVLLDSRATLEWTGRDIPDGTEWKTWSYTFTVAPDSPFAGKPVWFGVYGGHTYDGDQKQKSFAFDNLNITITPAGN